RERVDDRGLPGARARGRKDDHWSRRLEDLLGALENRLGEVGEIRTAVIDDGHVHGAEHAIRNRARPRNLEEVAPLMLAHAISSVQEMRWLPSYCIQFRQTQSNYCVQFL